jgi:hypothetical protein
MNTMGLAVFFGCRRCPAVYQATQHASDENNFGSFTCRNCGSVVHSWSNQHSYTQWRIFDPETGRVAGSTLECRRA